MRRAAHEFEIQAESICNHADAMTAEVSQAWWRGPDAERFKSRWTDVHQNAVRKIAGDLRRLAVGLRQEAARQEQASRA